MLALFCSTTSNYDIHAHLLRLSQYAQFRLELSISVAIGGWGSQEMGIRTTRNPRLSLGQVGLMSTIAVRLASRYINSASPLSIQQSGRLQQFLVMSGILCSVAAFACVYIGYNQKGHHSVIHDVDVAFELTCAPPEPSFRAVETLVPLKFEEGQKPAALAMKETNIKKTAIDLNKITQRTTTEPVKPHLASAVPEAPIAVAPIMSSQPSNPVANVLANPFGGSAANAASPVDSSAAGGVADGQAGATGPGGSGVGQGKGDTNSLAGGDFGANQLIAMKSAPVAMGNIGPYKRDIVARIKQTWHPDEDYSQVTVEIAIDRDGKVLEKQIVQSTGNSKIDTQLMAAIDEAHFGALPEWYRGSQLKIKLVLRNT